MSIRRIVTVVGARPQFVKAAAVSRAFAKFNETCGKQFDERIVHTGQHYDENMSKVFFDELNIPRPHVNLEVGSGSHGAQTGSMLEELEQVFQDVQPDCVLIYGDTNSTLAGALAAVKLHIPVAHVEAGLRSFNRKMPEEINRIVADSISSLLLCPTNTAVRHLASEGVTSGVHNVGDVMYDSVLFNTSLAEQSSDILDRLGLEPGSFYLSTIHRAENTDDPSRLAGILDAFAQIEMPIVLPLHPRTRKTLGVGLDRIGGNIRTIEPVPYLDMLMLEKSSRMILTDSGGVQKEAYWFSLPCVTLRDETEWVELVDAGCNRIVGADTRAILGAIAEFEANGLPADRPPDLYGDGHSAGKIVAILNEFLQTAGAN
ncbi:MAG: UDP-N-acetylglucosamine 2-epimerase (non-hydrolyzing) [Phycisphaerae bacterium]|nr:UDP-N-acetylglucosamine 2-epimerase (non-hydrolyzing) [Phycisphaerae bacterium]